MLESKITVERTTVRELSAEDYRRIYSLNFGTIGYMQGMLRMYRKPYCDKWGPLHIFLIRDEDGVIRAWALLTETTGQGYPEEGNLCCWDGATYENAGAAMFWTQTQYRRRGYGRALLDAIIDTDLPFYTQPHDEKSFALLGKYGQMI